MLPNNESLKPGVHAICRAGDFEKFYPPEFGSLLGVRFAADLASVHETEVGLPIVRGSDGQTISHIVDITVVPSQTNS